MLSARDSNSGRNLFSLAVIKRILDVLSDSGEMKKTNLAGKTGLNYPNCIRYLELLKLLGWVRNSGDGANHFQLTEQGIHFRSVLSSIGGNIDDQDAFGSIKLSESGGSKVASLARRTPSAHDNKSTYNIMLVDDEPDVLLTYKIFLTKQGYNVEMFPDAKSAVESIISIGPSYYDLAIADVRMKSLNGLQLYHRIKSIDPNLKVIFVTALDAVEELVSILPGASSKDVIRKPVNEQEFVKKVKEALRDVHVESRRASPNSTTTT
ncbi:MAG TPA: response regulator [Nitrososphaera sp.]